MKQRLEKKLQQRIFTLVCNGKPIPAPYKRLITIERLRSRPFNRSWSYLNVLFLAQQSRRVRESIKLLAPALTKFAHAVQNFGRDA
jgi:hypothetical protein